MGLGSRTWIPLANPPLCRHQHPAAVSASSALPHEQPSSTNAAGAQCQLHPIAHFIVPLFHSSKPCSATSPSSLAVTDREMWCPPDSTQLVLLLSVAEGTQWHSWASRVAGLCLGLLLAPAAFPRWNWADHNPTAKGHNPSLALTPGTALTPPCFHGAPVELGRSLGYLALKEEQIPSGRMGTGTGMGTRMELGMGPGPTSLCGNSRAPCCRVRAAPVPLQPPAAGRAGGSGTSPSRDPRGQKNHSAVLEAS